MTEQAAVVVRHIDVGTRDSCRCQQTGFFNLGAASERWIPTEQRVRPASAHARAEAGKPAPYIKCDSQVQRQV